MYLQHDRPTVPRRRRAGPCQDRPRKAGGGELSDSPRVEGRCVLAQSSDPGRTSWPRIRPPRTTSPTRISNPSPTKPHGRRSESSPLRRECGRVPHAAVDARHRSQRQALTSTTPTPVPVAAPTPAGPATAPAPKEDHNVTAGEANAAGNHDSHAGSDFVVVANRLPVDLERLPDGTTRWKRSPGDSSPRSSRSCVRTTARGSAGPAWPTPSPVSSSRTG